MIISFLGAVLIIFSPLMFGQNGLNGFNAMEGNLFLVLATLGYVISPLFLKGVLKKISPYLISFVGFLGCSFAFLPFAIGELKVWHFSQLNMAGVTGIVYGVLFSSALAYFLFYYGLSKISAQEVGIFTYLDPVAAILIAAPLLNEYPTIYFAIGAILVFGGVFVSERRVHYHPFSKLVKRHLV